MTVTEKDKFEKENFSYQIVKNEKIFIFWRSRQIKAFQGKEAQKLIDQIEETTPEHIQLLLAKATKNFKHGNEKNHPIPRED